MIIWSFNSLYSQLPCSLEVQSYKDQEKLFVTKTKGIPLVVKAWADKDMKTTDGSWGKQLMKQAM